MNINFDYNLKQLNTFGMEVSCACFAEYESEEDLTGFFEEGRQFSLPQPFVHIGGGSNLLFLGDFPGTVFHSGIRYIREAADSGVSGLVKVEVGAGTPWDEFCRWCAGHGLWGPENLSGIPGETGAAAVQNIGAYGVEFKDIVSEVRCFDTVTHAVRTFHVGDCAYGYRDSIFKQSAKGRYIVLSAIFELGTQAAPRIEYGQLRQALTSILSGTTPEEALTPAIMRKTVISIRDSKLPDPAVIGNAGSFFKNPIVPRSSYEMVENYARSKYGEDYRLPHFDAGSGFVKLSAAWLIDQCGWKGYREGNVAVYEGHPLVLVNATGRAVPGEVVALERKIITSVRNLFGIELVPEVEHVGELR